MGRKNATRPLWTMTRVDVLAHKSTHWFSEREHGLRLQCQCANQAGILERSLASMARIASGDGQTVTVTPQDIEDAIKRLSDTGHVVWFREYEVLWWVEMADEQKPSSASAQPDFWSRLRDQVADKLVNQVRHLICRKYPNLISGNSNDPTPEETNPEPDFNQRSLFAPLEEEVDQEKEVDQQRESGRRKATSARSRSRKPSRVEGVDDGLIDAVIDHINAARARLDPNAKGYRKSSKSQRRWVALATAREGASLDDWKQRIDRLAEAATRDSFWRQHLTLQHLHWAKNWEKWGDDFAIPPKRRRGTGHAPSAFDGPDQSFGMIGEEGEDVA